MERKKKGWFERIKRLFVSEPTKRSKQEKKGKSRRWLFVGRLKTQQSFALPAPAPAAGPAAPEEEQIRQAEDEQSKHAMAVALATAAAAEAAVAAAHAAAQVVRLTGHGQPPARAPSRHEQAALAIQSVYRGYLARRALRALKGLVRLQALIRGQAVRRQTAATLRGLESLMKIQARQRARASSPAAGDHPPPSAPAVGGDGMDALLRRGRELYYAAAAAAAVHEQQQQQQQSKGWNSSTLSKEEMSAMSRSREEAALKRVRALQYASLHNEKVGVRRQPMSREEMETLNQRWSWLEEWVGSQPFDKDIPVAHQSPCSRDAAAAAAAAADDDDDDDVHPAPPVVVRSRADSLACVVGGDGAVLDRQLGYSARRSFTRAGRRTPARDDDDDAAAAPTFPGYMASTASAKAKFRSMSTPKERSGGGPDAYSEQCFPFADRLLSPIPSMSPIPSIASDIVFARSSRPSAAQRSPRVKGPMTPTRSRSRRSPGRHSFGSEAALHQLQMEHYTPIR